MEKIACLAIKTDGFHNRVPEFNSGNSNILLLQTQEGNSDGSNILIPVNLMGDLGYFSSIWIQL